MLVAGITVSIVLFVLAGVFLVGGLLLLMMAPVLSNRLASTTSQPRLERRASGPDRYRTIINAQIGERKRRSSYAVRLTRGGAVLVGVALLSLVAGGVLALTGAGS
jgi:hypothetical protein